MAGANLEIEFRSRRGRVLDRCRIMISYLYGHSWKLHVDIFRHRLHAYLYVEFCHYDSFYVQHPSCHLHHSTLVKAGATTSALLYQE